MYVTIFPDFKHEHIDKDVGQITYMLSRELDLDANILSYNKMFDEGITCELGKINHILIPNIFKKVSHRFLDFNVVFFLLSNSKKINVLNLYHSTFCTHIYTIIYKLINKKGIAYIKLDLDLIDEKNNKKKKEKGIKNWIKRCAFKYFKIKANVVSVESKEAFELLLNKKKYTSSKLIRIPNGVCSTILNEKYGEVEYKLKRNIILTVARIGTEQKNNELMLLALEKCNLKNWTYLFVGPIENKFKDKIRVFFERNPHLVDTVQFLGPKNRLEIVDLYKKSKVFVLSSNYEGFPLVYAEASFYGCHIITTAVSGSADITNDGKLGDILPIGNYVSFSQAIQNVVDHDVSNLHFEEIRKYAVDNFTWEHILPCLTKKLANG